MLLGADEDDPEKKALYIGEGDPVLPRLKSHAINKDFWTEAIVFSSKDDYLTKTQVKYLEANYMLWLKKRIEPNLIMHRFLQNQIYLRSMKPK